MGESDKPSLPVQPERPDVDKVGQSLTHSDDGSERIEKRHG